MWGMEQGERDAAGEAAEESSLVSLLALLEVAVETVCAVEWHERDAEELVEAVGRVEVVSRRLEAAGCGATAELAAQHRARGRKAGGVAAMLGEKLGLSKGAVHGRIGTGGRRMTPAGRAAADGAISGEHERIIAKALAVLPGRWAVRLRTGSPRNWWSSPGRPPPQTCARRLRVALPSCARTRVRIARSIRSGSGPRGSGPSGPMAPARSR